MSEYSQNSPRRVQRTYTEQAVQDDLRRQKAQGRTLRAIAAEYENITYGDIQRALKGQFPKSARKRHALNLSALAPAPVCPTHGVVHTRKTCPSDKPAHDLYSLPVKVLREMLVNRKEWNDA